MPRAAVQLVPGVNVTKTLAENQAGVSQSQLIRYRDQMIETYGGSFPYINTTIASTVRSLWAWEGFESNSFVGVGATQSLSVIQSAANIDITPSTFTTNPAPNFSINVSSNIVTVVDINSGVTTYDTVYFNTPISLASIILTGAYPITAVLSTASYQFTIPQNSSATIASSGILPIFNISSGSAAIKVTFPSSYYQSVVGLFYPFTAATQIGSTNDGILVQGNYQIASVPASSYFNMNASVQASTTAQATMNSSLAQLMYYVAQGPLPSGAGFGAGAFGAGPFGIGVTGTSGTTGAKITATDWTMANWGEVLLSCVFNGPIYAWSPDSGLQTAQVVSQAPFINGGIFVSMPQQILVAWASDQTTGSQDKLLVRWSDSGSYTTWAATTGNSAGSFHIPTGSVIMGGIQGPSQGYIWTDIEVWAMSWVGQPVVFNFTKLGGGCGLVGPHACGILNDTVYWCGFNNFFTIMGNGVRPIPCPVWDFVFQNMNVSYRNKIVCAPNSAFNEVTWFFPSAASTGENDSYVKYNVLEKEWDYGTLSRSAWVDVSVVGNPLGAEPVTGQIYQHETGNVTFNQPVPSFRSGWWAISEGQEMGYVDFVQPDFKWGTFSGPQNANITLIFYAVDYPGDTVRTYGPFVVTSATEYINPRVRGRLMAVLIQGQGWWRIGRIRFKTSSTGRR